MRAGARAGIAAAASGEGAQVSDAATLGVAGSGDGGRDSVWRTCAGAGDFFNILKIRKKRPASTTAAPAAAPISIFGFFLSCSIGLSAGTCVTGALTPGGSRFTVDSNGRLST